MTAPVLFALPRVPELSLLSECLEGGDPDIRRRALRTLEAVGVQARATAPRVAEHLDGPDGDVALAALVSVAPDHPALLRTLEQALFSHDYATWSWAAGALARVEPPILDPLIDRVLDAVVAGAPAERSRGLRLLPRAAELRPSLVLQVACDLLEDDDLEQVRPVLAALERLGPQAAAALPSLLTRLRGDPEVRDAALDVIGVMGPEAERAIPALLELVSSGDAGIRVAAARTLRALAPEALVAAPVLARAMRSGIEAEDWWAIGECASTLGAIGQELPESTTLVLEEALIRASGAHARTLPDADPDTVDCIESILNGLAAVGPAARRTLPLIVSLVSDPQLGPAAAAAISAIDRDAEPLDEADEGGLHWVALDSPIDFPAAPRQPAPRLLARALPRALELEVRSGVVAAKAFAGVEDGSPVGEVIRSIAWSLEQTALHRLSADDASDLAFDLGVLWAEQLVRAMDWQWVELVWDEGSAPAVVSPDRAHACLPMRLLADAIESGAFLPLTEVFERIRQARLTPCPPGALSVIG